MQTGLGRGQEKMQADIECGQAKKAGRHGMGRTGMGGKGMERTGMGQAGIILAQQAWDGGQVWDGGRHGAGVQSYGGGAVIWRSQA
jgi:hypothetical protein